jgi:ferredoxin-NADP reductase
MGQSAWQTARVVEIVPETPRFVTVVVEPERWPHHGPGQYVELAPHATAAEPIAPQWIASGAHDGYLAVTLNLEELADLRSRGQMTAGATLCLRGPHGKTPAALAPSTAPLLIVCGGRGITPFRGLLRDWAAVDERQPVRMLYSARSFEDVLFRDELLRLAAYEELDLRIALTRRRPRDWQGLTGRLSSEVVTGAAWTGAEAVAAVAGPAPFTRACVGALRAQSSAERVVALRLPPWNDALAPT